MKSAVEKVLVWIGKACKWLLILWACYLAVCAVVSWTEKPAEPEHRGLEWVREESELLGYEINEDRIRVRYSVRLVNHDPDVDWKLEYFTLKFTPKAVNGWLKYEDYYICTLENGESSMVLKGGESREIILVFDGEYFHGEVPDELPLPRNLLYMMSIHHDASQLAESAPN